MARRAPTKPARFGPRGERLWGAHEKQVIGERGLVLLEEACRTADRLDRLDDLLVGRAEVWAVVLNEVEDAYEVRVTGVLVEARQQQTVLAKLISSLPLKELDDGDDGAGWLDDDAG